MNTYELIKKKRDGVSLSTKELAFLIDGFTHGQIPDYQMSAFLMAVYFSGMSARECVDLTMCMANSGSRVDLSPIKGFKLDKHSTGGVGDKTSLILAPLVASCGGIVAKMSGRELGHTGGTIDKLESIPGMQTGISQDQFIDITNRVHMSIIAQTATLAPADKRIYALRNVTATVDVIPLIAASIMSKKLAAGADGIVLDVKTGAGAFTPRYKDALKLAQTMVDIGKGADKKISAYITGMAQPLGNTIGNAVEIKEVIETLNGKGPADLTDLVMVLGSEMLVLAGIASSPAEARKKLNTNLANGKGVQVFKAFIEAHGGDTSIVDDPEALPQAANTIPVAAGLQGFVQNINALEAGMAAKVLGAGRQTKEENLDHSVGIVLRKKVGDAVKKDEPLAILHTDGDLTKIDLAATRLKKAFTIGADKKSPSRLIHARVSIDGVEEFMP